MNCQVEELKGGKYFAVEELKDEKLLVAAKRKDVRLSVYLSAQSLRSSFGCARRWTEEDRSGSIWYLRRTGQASQTLWRVGFPLQLFHPLSARSE